MAQKQLRYRGAISYETLRTGSVVSRFDFIDSHTVLFDLVSTAPGQLTTRLLGVAELLSGRSYRSPWIGLTCEDGSALKVDARARVEFTVEDHTQSEVRVTGKFIHSDLSLDFSGFLQSRDE